ncbi:hypothetical protein AMECASPLE_024202 [Ameca splendens]|uniref:Uncharacterized protein n=1 Tax=Ameca splendens TaxID=208324 RepID=A0ABV1AAL0_9TELE
MYHFWSHLGLLWALTEPDIVTLKVRFTINGSFRARLCVKDKAACRPPNKEVGNASSCQVLSGVGFVEGRKDSPERADRTESPEPFRDPCCLCCELQKQSCNN